MSERGRRRILTGVVVSDKMDKTVVVLVERRFRHPLYHKFVKQSKKFHAHDEKNQCGVGDKVRLIESRPMSRSKRWNVVEVVQKAI